MTAPEHDRPVGEVPPEGLRILAAQEVRDRGANNVASIIDATLDVASDPRTWQALLTQLHEARVALEALGRERNTWARQMADLRDERDTAREAEAAARLDHGRLATERDVAQVEADEARAEVARLRVGMGGAKENRDRARRGLVDRANAAETREAALRAGIEGLAGTWERLAANGPATFAGIRRRRAAELRALLDGEVGR